MKDKCCRQWPILIQMLQLIPENWMYHTTGLQLVIYYSYTNLFQERKTITGGSFFLSCSLLKHAPLNSSSWQQITIFLQNDSGILCFVHWQTQKNKKRRTVMPTMSADTMTLLMGTEALVDTDSILCEVTHYNDIVTACGVVTRTSWMCCTLVNGWKIDISEQTLLSWAICSREKQSVSPRYIPHTNCLSKVGPSVEWICANINWNEHSFIFNITYPYVNVAKCNQTWPNFPKF